jgi:hypothetical protein
MLGMSPFKNMPAEVAAEATKMVGDISSGKNKVFVGPIVDQSGATKIAAGVTMNDMALNQMQWLVQGVEGKLT